MPLPLWLNNSYSSCSRLGAVEENNKQLNISMMSNKIFNWWFWVDVTTKALTWHINGVNGHELVTLLSKNPSTFIYTQKPSTSSTSLVFLGIDEQKRLTLTMKQQQQWQFHFQCLHMQNSWWQMVSAIPVSPWLIQFGSIFLANG